MPALMVAKDCCFLGTETKLTRSLNTRPCGTPAGDRGFCLRPQTRETSLSRTSLPHRGWEGLNLLATGV